MSEILHAFGVDWRLLLIQAVNFGITLAVLYYVLYRPLIKLVDERREKVAQGVRDAESASLRLAEADRSSADALAKAGKEAELLVANAGKYAKEEERRIVAEASERAEAIAKEGALRAEEEKRRVLAESKEEIARMAVLAAERVMREGKTS